MFFASEAFHIKKALIRFADVFAKNTRRKSVKIASKLAHFDDGVLP
jgi:hypothetical protein